MSEDTKNRLPMEQIFYQLGMPHVCGDEPKWGLLKFVIQ